MSDQQTEREIGNQEIASDLYGTGIRIGLYLQVHGILFSCMRGKSRGIMLTCYAFLIAVLASWTTLALDQQISPAEFIVIMNLANIMFAACSATVCHPKAIIT